MVPDDYQFPASCTMEQLGSAPTCQTPHPSPEARDAHQRQHHPRQYGRRNPGGVVLVDGSAVETKVKRQEDINTVPTVAQLVEAAELAHSTGVEFPEVRTEREGEEAVEKLREVERQGTTYLRRNRYRAPCIRCGEVVEEGEGGLEFDQANDRWVVEHNPSCRGFA